MSSYALCIAAVEFAEKCNAELREKKAQQLEKDGLMVRRSSVDQ
jgi:hypothetical protein